MVKKHDYLLDLIQVKSVKNNNNTKDIQETITYLPNDKLEFSHE